MINLMHLTYLLIKVHNECPRTGFHDKLITITLEFGTVDRSSIDSLLVKDWRKLSVDCWFCKRCVYEYQQVILCQQESTLQTLKPGLRFR